MKTIQFALASAALAAAFVAQGAAAQQPSQSKQYVDPVYVTSSGLTRNQVRADILNARDHGSLFVTDNVQAYTDRTPSTLRSRAQSEAEALQARIDGTLVVTDYNVRYAPATRSTLSRSEVRTATRAEVHEFNNAYFDY